MRHARHQRDDGDHAGHGVERRRLGEHLLAHQAGDFRRLVGAGDDDRRGGGQQQRRNLRGQAVTDTQQREQAPGFGGGQVVHQHADGEAADQVDQQDQDAGDGVAAHELGGAIHGPVEVGFLGHVGAALARVVGVDQAGVEIGVDGHLLAGQRVQGEARGHFGDALATLGDHQEVHDGEDDEDDDADDEVAADHHLAERLDHLARCVGAGVAFEQHDTGGGHVERQTQQRGDQNHRRQ